MAGILGLFWLARQPNYRASWTIWIPTLWLLIAGSRHVSEWWDPAPLIPSQQQYLEGSPVDASIYAFFIAAAIAVLTRRRAAVSRYLRSNWPILVFVLYCAFSILWSDFPGVALKRWVKSLGDYAMILVLLTETDWKAALRTVLARVGLVLLPVSLLLIKYYPALGRAYALHWDSTQSLIGVSDTKNMLGLICLVLGFAAVCQLLSLRKVPAPERTRLLIANIVVVALAVRLLLISDSMTSFACFLLASSVVLAHRYLRSFRKRSVLHLAIAALVLCSSSVLFLGVGGGALHSLGRNSTLTGRTAIWAILTSVPVNPLGGCGFESFWLGPRLDYLWSFSILNGITEAHNGYLEMYLNLGILGLLLLGTLLWFGYRNVVRFLDLDSDMGRLRLGYFVIALVYNFTEAGFRPGDLIWFSFILAISIPPSLRRLPARTRVAALEPVEERAMAAGAV